ncbi:permease [Endozoicomonas sp. SCSIO W0465]|uniref:permease n=1 Tax=Endozoicomonas sp. SCSIO W0465 TaxID=2918516 RepID=UPI0020750B8F|nr:permease [Endozoicomonas sp. SCSIO W0465]USE36680.1 permease [Endozoicomonas sp. SCSIO W0465]
MKNVGKLDEYYNSMIHWAVRFFSMVVVDFLYTLAMLVWHMLWPLVFGFSLSAVIRSYVPGEMIIRRLGENGVISGLIATAFGAVSSVCNYATVGMGHTLRLKGASWGNTLAYMIASTNIGITMLIAVYGFLGPVFLNVMVVAGLIFLVLSYLLSIVFTMPAPEEPKDADAMAMKEKNNWQAACDYFRDDVAMTRKDILTGFVVASAVSVFMPPAWWDVIFGSYQDHGVMAWGWNAVMGIIVTIITFGCSIGNVSLAAVMWWHGVSSGGVMAFLLASLLTFPMLKVTAGYYGMKTTIKSTIVLSLGIILSCLMIDALLQAYSITLVRNNVITMTSGNGMLFTVAMNIAFAILAVLMYRKGRKMSM